MGTLGIITCEILEREIAYMLARDPDVERVTVLEDARSDGLIELLESQGARNVQRIPHVSSFRPEPSEGLNVIVRVLEMGLHRNGHVLDRALSEAARELSFYVKGLFLGYGSCGRWRRGMRERLGVTIPVFFPKDGGRRVDDCIGLFIGGRKNYYAEQCKVPGTFFITSGWACHWQEMFESFGLDTRHFNLLKKMFAHYTRFLLILTPVMERDEMRNRIQGLKEILDLDIEEYEGTLDPLIEAWNDFKAYLESKTGRCVWIQ